MKIGTISSLRLDRLSHLFDRIASFNLHTTQLCGWNADILSPELAATVVLQSKLSGVDICAYWAGYCEPHAWNFTEGPVTLGLVPPKYRKKRIAELKRGADFARMLGAKAIITHCGFLPENMTDPEYEPVRDAIADVALYCKSLGIEFWFETGQETPVVLLRVIEEINSGNMGINLDPANLIMYGKGNPCDALEVFGKYVRNLHVKDGLPPTNGHQLGHEVQVGKGFVNFPKLIPRLKQLGFDGELIIEREISEGDEQKHDILETVQNLNKWWNA